MCIRLRFGFVVKIMSAQWRFSAAQWNQQKHFERARDKVIP